MRRYILSIDQSTQGTKALLFDEDGAVWARRDAAHRQIVDARGFVSHDAEEIYDNTIRVTKLLFSECGILPEQIAGISITNQRETALLWDRTTGKPLGQAVVWQCGRGKPVCDSLHAAGRAEDIRRATGLPLSPYFSGAKLWWLLNHTPDAKRKMEEGTLCAGTMDSYLIYRMTGGRVFATEYSNASRTQLFNLHTLTWDAEVCADFQVAVESLPAVLPSDGQFGETDLEGNLPYKLPICAVMGDSHSALYAHGCICPGMVKTTYGTGASIMMNVGDQPVEDVPGLATSLAWHLDGRPVYVLEGNINYAGAVISWLKDNLNLIESAGETQELAERANPLDTTYLVPAFTGLGAPYFKEEARGALAGMSRTTGKAEIVRAGLEAIAYQIRDVLTAMKEETKLPELVIHADGGASRNKYLMQFQSDITGDILKVSGVEELSAMGVAYAAGIKLGLYDAEKILRRNTYTQYGPLMNTEERDRRIRGWQKAVEGV